MEEELNRESSPLIFCVDVEPDEYFIDPSRKPDMAGFLATREILEEWRQKKQDVLARPVHFSWFVRADQPLERVCGDRFWIFSEYADVFHALRACGDTVGLHPHAYRWSDALDEWVADHGDAVWVEECARAAVEGYHGMFGYPCEAFRFGDRFMNEAVMAVLNRNGVRFDLTVEPGMAKTPAVFPDKPHAGDLPDYTAAPRSPYRPSPTDFLAPHDGLEVNTWVIPVSTTSMVQSSGETQIVPLNMALDPALCRAVLDDEASAIRVAVMRCGMSLYEHPRKNLVATLAELDRRGLHPSTPSEAMRVLPQRP
jgi:hypothetical protein